MADTLPFRFRAFLSYSHRDTRWATWLHGALESYRIDKELVGRATAQGPVPASLRPIFRDRDDFSAGQSLTAQTLAALEASQFLIVICSPDAARSYYVNEEIRRFKALARSANVIPLIVDGEPGDPDRECFPPALRFKPASDGTLTEEPEELIAADARAKGDGKEAAKLKIVAGLLGLGLDEIVRRAERARRRRNRVWSALAGLLVLLTVLATGSAVYAYQKLIESEERLDQAIEFASGFITEASGMSARFGVPTDLTLALLRRAETALDALLSKRPASAALRYRKALVQLEFSSAYQKLGRLDEAIARATEAKGLLEAITRDNPTNTEWLYRLAGAYDTLAQQLRFNDDTAGTLANYTASLAVLERLAKIEPDNVRWQAALLWNRRVIGEYLLEQGSSTKALASYRQAFADLDLFDKSHPGSNSGSDVLIGITKLVDSLGNLLALQGAYEAALKSLDGNLKRKKQWLAVDPNSNTWQFELRDSYRYAGTVLAALGSYDEALASFRSGIEIDQRASTGDPKFLGPRRSVILFDADIADVLFAQERLEEALSKARETLSAAERLAAEDTGSIAWPATIGRLRAGIGDILLVLKKPTEAAVEYQFFLSIIEPLASARPNDLGRQADLAQARFRSGAALQAQGMLRDAKDRFRSAFAGFDRLARTDPNIVRYQVLRLMARWHLVECGDESAGPPDAILAAMARLGTARKLTAFQQKWLKEARQELAAPPPP